MRKATVFLGIFAVAALVSCKDKASEKINADNVAQAAQRDDASRNLAVITFENKEHDFGTIEQGTPQETVFAFTNTGQAPLIITNTSASCGCTTPDAPINQPIAPGETGEIKVRFNGSGSGQVTKTVTVQANTAAGQEMLRIKAFVTPKAGAGTAAVGPVAN